MKACGKRFLKELEKALKNHPESKMILEDYEAYIYDLIADVTDEKVTYELLITRIGTPKELAKTWRAETNITESRTKWIFILTNIFLFLCGILLTAGYHLFEWQWVERVWNGMTSFSSLVMIMYTLFWALLGYEIGKEFGENGKRLLKRTVTISIIPNITLMFLVVFQIIPIRWFAPHLTIPFIIGCVCLTALFYPISLLGYKWGRKQSV